MLKELYQKLNHSTVPVAMAIQKTNCNKVLAIAFKEGMILKEHKTDSISKLLVIKGSVIYRENNLEQVLPEYSEKEIPTHIYHSLQATTDSLCLLFQEY